MKDIEPQWLRRVPGCEAGEAPRSIQALAGGRGANRVWRVQTAAGDFVLRLRHEPLDRPGCVSGFELAAHRLAAQAGLAPRVLDAAPDGRWLMMEYVDWPAWSDADLLSEAGLDALGELLQRLHALPCPALPGVDVPGIARGYLQSITVLRPQQGPGATEAVAAIEGHWHELQQLSGRAVLNHGDLMAANVMGPVAGARLRLVDWEYAQCADPTWDVACLLAYYPTLVSRLERLLAVCGLSSAEDRQILSLQRRLFEGLNCLWQQTERGNWIS